MAPHSSTLAGKIPWMEEPCRLQSMGSLRVGHDWVTSLSLHKDFIWPPDAKNWLIWKDPDAAKDWRQEEKGMTEGEMVGWHHDSMDMFE